ncbi:MAG: hypothetical protein KGN00_08150 [Chloroflexota bacterium]|nr:hypothetical protein [Chloroflexota bacterium]MDE3193642.1 hypothetical protein [Chloroflexota bacterium]
MTIGRRGFLSLAIKAAGGIALASCAPAGPASSAPSGAGATAASAAASAAGIKRGGIFRIADVSDQKTLDPAQINTTPMRSIGRAIYDTLVDVDLKGNYTPALAERWENPDPKTWILYLRKGVKYSDGTPFDASVVKFNIERHLDPKTKSKQIGELLAVDTVEVVDASTAKFHLKTPNAGFLSPFVDRTGFMANPAEVKKWGNNDYGQHPSGVGPFRLVDHKDDTSYTVEKNPDYWDKDHVYLDQVEWKVIPLDATRLVELRSGGVDLAEDLPLQNVNQMKAMSEIVLSERSGARFYFARWNMDDKFGKSLPLRQAFNWILDRDAIFNAVFFKTGVIGYDPFFPSSPFYDASYKPYTRDAAKAKALIDKADLPSPKKFTIYPDSGAVGQKLAQVMAANLGELGLDVAIQYEDTAARTARENKGDWTFSVYSQSRFAYRPDPAQYLGALWDSKSTYYRSGKLKDPETDKLIASGEAESDPAKRRTIYRQLADRINELASAAFFEDASDFKGLSPTVKGFVHMPDVINRLKGIWLDK